MHFARTRGHHPRPDHKADRGLRVGREIVIATVSGSTAPVEIRKVAQLAARYDWSDPPSKRHVRYRNYTHDVLD